jgi:hypothetical protein
VQSRRNMPTFQIYVLLPSSELSWWGSAHPCNVRLLLRDYTAQKAVIFK